MILEQATRTSVQAAEFEQMNVFKATNVMLQFWLRIKQDNWNSNKIIDSRIDEWSLLDPCLIGYIKNSDR